MKCTYENHLPKIPFNPFCTLSSPVRHALQTRIFFSSTSTVLRCRLQANFRQRVQMPPLPTGLWELQTPHLHCIRLLNQFKSITTEDTEGHGGNPKKKGLGYPQSLKTFRFFVVAFLRSFSLRSAYFWPCPPW